MDGDERMSDQSASTAALLQRNVAVDAYRGLVMLLMMGEVLNFALVARSFPNSTFWQILSFNQSHVEWTGMGLHDMIQPSFTFLVGVALPYSLRSRLRKGETFNRMVGHTIWRSFLLVALGIFLRSIHSDITNFTFEDTLTQIGLGYTFAFLLTFVRPRWQWTAFGVILFGYWLAWALYPAPGVTFPYASVGVPPEWHQHLLQGFSSHWNKNSNLGQAFDVWFLNPVSQDQALPLQRRRLPYAQLHSYARHHASFHRHQPHREAGLDACLDAVQWGRLLPVSGCILLGDRRKEARTARVPTGGCRC